jgi:hypothetical protein
MVRISKVLHTIISFLILISIYCAVVFNLTWDTEKSLAFSGCLINGMVALIQILRKGKQGYSLQVMFWIFCYLFNFVAPCLQIERGVFSYLYTIDLNVCMYVNIMLLICYIVIILITDDIIRLSRNRKSNLESKINTGWLYKSVKPTTSFMFFITAICIAICSYFVYSFGLEILWSRTTAHAVYSDNNVLSLLQKTVLQYWIAISLIFSIQYYRGKKNIARGLLVCLLLFLLVIAFPPISLSRFKTAAIYGGIILICFRNLGKGFRFTNLFLFGMLVIFPVIDAFRYATGEALIERMIMTLHNLTSPFYTGDYDSYSMFARATEYVEVYGKTFGRQLLGVIFFFIPRSVWPNKPIGSGEVIGRAQGQEFTNISCQIFGEGYINFGFLGALAFAIIIGILIKKIDYIYRAFLKDNQDFTTLSIIYPGSIFLFYFLCRGDLLSTFSSLIGFIGTVVLMVFICRRGFGGK